MKKSYLITAFLVVMALLFSGCEQPTSPNTPDAGDSVDKTALTSAIADAETLLGSVSVGNNIGDVIQSAYDAYSAAIADAKTIEGYSAPSQTEVDGAVADLASATTSFNSSILVIARLTSTPGVVNFTHIIEEWGSGTTIDQPYVEDLYYDSIIKLTSGTNWGPAFCVAFREYTANEVLQYTALDFKIKTSDYTAINVSMPGATTEQVTYNIADGTALNGDWVQISVPLSDFGTLALGQDQFAILNVGTAGTVYITDVEFSGTNSSAANYLVTAISNAQTLMDSKVVGTDDGNVPQSAKDDFTIAIATAQAVVDGGSPTFAEIQTAIADLDSATIDFNSTIVIAVPTTLPSAPALAAGDVISLYNSSATYTDSPGINWNPNWGQSGSLSDTTVDSGTVKLLDLIVYQGVDFDANRIDITGKTTLHISYWTANGSVFSIYPIDASGETQILTPTLTQGSWAELEIDVSAMADPTTLRQIKFTGATTLGGAEDAGNCKIWFDNIYFH